jgi:hypothetical protein
MPNPDHEHSANTKVFHQNFIDHLILSWKIEKLRGIYQQNPLGGKSTKKEQVKGIISYHRFDDHRKDRKDQDLIWDIKSGRC